ncbi:hypothetical protein RSOLAG22IIIB_09306 [Rhizoctonia solani]|uniref:Uncharacterized protein n=1 Tax=Rhizoctonia solani TaxID=456999 RepID=A0A0K6FYA8_9AGAM|nr:hypothetical protein RSOLAG22IIIB_09306 [Rhizoctonia solani]
MLSEVWKMIREDDGFDITKGKEQELQSGSTSPVVASVVDQQETRPENAGTEERESHQQGSSGQSPNGPVDLALLTNVSIQPISEIDSAHENKFPNINVDNSTSGHIHSRASSIVNTNNSPISHPAVETQGETSASHEQQDTGSGIDLTKPRDSTGAQEPPEDLTSPGDSQYRPSVLVERSRALKSRTGMMRSEGIIPEIGLTHQEAIRELFKGMVKSTSYIYYFRHQCIALIQIYRHFWTMVEITDADEYQSLHRFGLIADHALQTIVGNGPKKQIKEELQEELDKVIVGLEEYYGTLSGSEDYDPISLMCDARAKDQERSFKLKQVEKLKLKKVAPIKAQVDFYIHDGSEFPGRICHCLLQAYERIIDEYGKISRHSRCLIEIGPTSETPPENVVEGTKIRRRMIHELPTDSTSSHASAINNNAAARVKAMVEKIEKEKKEAKNRNKDAEKKKGFLSKVFGR